VRRRIAVCAPRYYDYTNGDPPLKNPYIVDRPLTDQDLFFGREAAFSRLNEFLSGGRKLMLLYGKRGIGKTSFINQLTLRLATRYAIQPVAWDSLGDDEADPLWRVMLGIARATGQPDPDREFYRSTPETMASDYIVSTSASLGDDAVLVCLDGIPAADMVDDRHWSQALNTLKSALRQAQNLAILLVVEGFPDLTDADLAGLPAIGLGPLRESEVEEILTVPARGRLTYEYDAIRRIHNLSGGEPYFVQVFGRTLFDARARNGWVGMPEVDLAVDRTAALGAPWFQEAWDQSDPAARITMCAFAEMVGHHGVGSADDALRYLARLRIQIPREDIVRAMDELSARDIFEQLGGDTYRFRNALYRLWVRQNHNTLDVVRQAQRYRRSRVRRVPTRRARHVDWVGLLLWLVAGLLVVGIAYVWRTRPNQITWIGEPTLAAGASALVGDLPPAPEGTLPGRIAYMARETADDPWDIYVMRADGSERQRLTEDESNNMAPVWSPDGRRIAFVSDRDGNREIYVMSASGSNPQNLTRHDAEDWTPAWSPDGRRIAFSSFREGNWDIYVMDANGSNVRRLTENDAADYSPAWSPDGSHIAFVSDRDGNLEVYTMNADGSNQTRFTRDGATDQSPAWSSDGTLLVWESYREGNMELYVANADGSDVQNLSRDSFANAHGPTWSPWGKHIAFFSNRDGGWNIFVLDLETGERTNITMDEMIEQAPHWGR
jgi:hypothetical protein